MRFSTALAKFLFLGWGFLMCGAFSVQADQEAPELRSLFERLQARPGMQEAQQIEREIWRLWTTSEDEEINGMMQAGVEAMRQQNYPEALQVFSDMTALAPNFAEGWNKRATVHYLLQNYEASISDIETTLSLEPRHFGALSGLGLVHLAQQNYYEALHAYERVLKIHPTLVGATFNLHRIKQYLKKQVL